MRDCAGRDPAAGAGGAFAGRPWERGTPPPGEATGEASYVESFLVLNAAGGDCLEDFDQLRADAGLSELLGHAVPSAEAARKFLYQFHDGEKIEQAQQALAAERVSYIPEENPALQGLAQVNQAVVRELGRRCAEQKIATLDVDATIIE